MKSFHFLGLACALGLIYAPAAVAQNPAYLPLPQVETSYASPYAADARAPAYTAAAPNEGGLVRRGWMLANTPSDSPSPSDSIGPGAQLNTAPDTLPQPMPEGVPQGTPDGYTYDDGYGYGGYGHGGGLLGHMHQKTWYAWGGGLIMNRVSPRAVSLAYDDATNINVLDTNTGDGMWSGGFEVGLGFQCGACSRMEISYWGLYPGCQGGGIDSFDLVGNLNSTFDFDPLTFDDGVPANETPVNNFFNNATRMWYVKNYQIHNLELNFWQGNCNACGMTSSCGMSGSCGHGGCGGCDSCCTPCNRWNMQFLAGLRYFRFDEQFEYHSELPTEDPYYVIETENSLIGLQLGARLDYLVGQRWGFYATPKFGVYNNHMTMWQYIQHPEAPWINGPYGGTAAVDSTSTVNPGQVFDVTASRDRIAFLGQIDIGVDYFVASNWKIGFGYRAMAASNVAMTTEQIPTYFGDIDALRDIHSDSTLVLHGAFLNTEITW